MQKSVNFFCVYEIFATSKSTATRSEEAVWKSNHLWINRRSILPIFKWFTTTAFHVSLSQRIRLENIKHMQMNIPYYYLHSNRFLLFGFDVCIEYHSNIAFDLPAPIEVTDWIEAWWTQNDLYHSHSHSLSVWLSIFQSRASDAFHDWHSPNSSAHFWLLLLFIQHSTSYM